MPATQTMATLCRHRDRPVRAWGRCGACYESWRKTSEYAAAKAALVPDYKKNCRAQECAKLIGKSGGHGLCGGHLSQHKAAGYPEGFEHLQPLQKRAAKGSRSICAVCDKPAARRGLCTGHWQQHHAAGEPVGHEHLKPLRKKAPQRSLREWMESHANYKGDDCLRWPYHYNGDGYATTVFDGRHMGAHRAMCILKHGDAPFEGAQAAHSCGRGHKGCLNPNHIRWLSGADNLRERADHGTMPVGEKQHLAKLTNENVRLIRRSALDATELGRMLGVATSTIKRVRARQTWKHVD